MTRVLPIPVVHCEQCGVVPVRVDALPVVLPRDVEPTGEGNPLAERPDFLETSCPTVRGPRGVRPTRSIAISTPSGSGCRRRCRRGTATSGCSPTPTCVAGCPPSDSSPATARGGFVFDQRVVTKALRDIGTFDFLADGEPFAGCLFHEMVVADGRKMSKHLGNVVDPDELVVEHGADTVRLAILYAAGPAKALNWTDGALRFASRFLRGLWAYAQESIAAAADAPDDPKAAADTAFIRERLGKWCDNGLERITADLEELQMHKAVRNVTRLLERVEVYEKRIVQRRGRLGREDYETLLEALVLLARTLSPFAPHIAEELLVALGRDASVGFSARGESLPLSAARNS